MSEWQWQVPSLRGSPWDPHSGGLIVQTEQWPMVNVYCDHGGRRPYLFGMFYVSHEVFEELGEISWHFCAKYLTGDGYLIRLKKSSGEAIQTLSGNTLMDLKGMRSNLMSAGERSAYEVTGDVIDAFTELAEAVDSVRYKWKFDCPRCGYAINVRSDRAQEVLTKLAHNQFFEVSTRQLSTLLA